MWKFHMTYMRMKFNMNEDREALTMQRYFLPPEQFHAATQTVTIEGDDAHHLGRVMRAEVGDKVICSNGVDREVLVRILSYGQGSCYRGNRGRACRWMRKRLFRCGLRRACPKAIRWNSLFKKGPRSGQPGFFLFYRNERLCNMMRRKKRSARSAGRKLPRKRRNKPTATVCRRLNPSCMEAAAAAGEGSGCRLDLL